MRISCPPTVAPCYYGIDTPHRDELIAAHRSIDEIRDFMGADTLAYLSMDGLLEAVGKHSGNYCTACYNKDYPVPPPRDERAYMQMALKMQGGDSRSQDP